MDKLRFPRRREVSAQQARGKEGTGEDNPGGPPQSSSPRFLRRLVLSPWGRAFLLLLPLLLLWGGVELWSRWERQRFGAISIPAPSLSSPEPSPSPAPSLHPAIAAFLELERLREKAFRELRPELLDEVYHPNAPQLAEEKRRLEEWRQRGYRLEGRYRQVLEVLVAVEDPRLRLTGLYVRIRSCGLRVLDPAGRVIDASTPGNEYRSGVHLAWSPSRARWSIMGVSDESGMPPPPSPISSYVNSDPPC